MPLPRQHEVDMSDPKRRFLWAFRNIAYNGVPLAAPEQVFCEWSEHLSKAGFVHVSEVEAALEGCADAERVLGRLPSQEIHFQPPVRGQDHPFNTAGCWIPVSEEIVEPELSSAACLTPAEKAKLIGEFREEGLID